MRLIGAGPRPSKRRASAAAATRPSLPARSSTLFLLVFLSLHLGSHRAAAYHSWSEGAYLSNFDELESHAYSAVDDPSVAPAGLLEACRRSDGTPVAFDGSELVLASDGYDDPLDPSVPTVSAASTQAQCDAAPTSVCVVPRGVRLRMDGPLNVAALKVRGELYWRDGVEQTTDEQWLCAGYVAVEGPTGKFVMHVSTKTAWIYIKDNGANHPMGRTRFFGGVGDTSGNVYEYNNAGPTVEVSGRAMARTWSLLAVPFKAGETSMKLLHSPVRMGWRVGDRLGVSPTQKGSDGTGHVFRIVAMDDDGTVHVNWANPKDRSATFLPPSQSLDEPETRSAALLSAEVVNLSRNVVLTGDDFRHVPCGTDGCPCSEHRTQCTMGVHAAQMHHGTMAVRDVRVEKCGQRGVPGKYCLHFHRVGECPTCEFKNNAIEHGHQRGIIVHGTHRTTVESNVIWGVRGAGIYVEDGNEMLNQIKYNVVVCPWSLAHPVLAGCTIPGTDNAESDTPLNQAGIYTDTAANDFIGNRVCNSFNGLLLQASGTGKGAAYGKVCTSHLEYGRWEGNTFHGHSRFGLYTLGGSTPRDTDQSVERDGFNADQANTCKAMTNDGWDRGRPVAILNHVDWHTVFVGHYNAGDMQHRGHVSQSNNNLIYWKETKNFADGCAAHIVEGYYADGNMALPDQSTFIMERTTFNQYVVLEANHHCNVGVTGMLCMPQYVFHDVAWKATYAPTWIWPQRGGTGGGGIFTLSPPNADTVMSATLQEQQAMPDRIFPPGYVSLASKHYTYLASTEHCISSNDIGMGTRYSSAILCKSPLRALKIWSTNFHKSTAPSLKVEVWLNNTLPGTSEQDSRGPDHTQMVNFHSIADLGGGKQGYSLPVFIRADVSYRLSLGPDSLPVPGDWILEFSDAVMGNRWDEEFVNLNVVGRFCENNGVISSQHSRKYMYGLGFTGAAWGNSGACVESTPPKMPAVNCESAAFGKVGTTSSNECPNLCSPACDATNSFCHCGSAMCACKPGFAGADCSIDLCSKARCGEHGICSARYLGDSSLLPVANRACICDEGWTGPLCDQQSPTNIARNGIASQSSVCWEGTPSRAIDGNTNQNWGGNSVQHTCQEDSPWWQVELPIEQIIAYVVVFNRQDSCCVDRLNDSVLQVLDSSGNVVASQPIVNVISKNHIYLDGNVVGKYVRVKKNVYGDLNIAEVQVFNQAAGCGSCSASEDDECLLTPRCNQDGSCATSGTASASYVANNTPCNSKPLGTCQDGQCIEPETSSPTLRPTLAPITLTPTDVDLSTRIGLVGTSAVASQSSTCHGGIASRAIDGNTDGNWYRNSVQHTCVEANPWLKIDLGQEFDYIVSRVTVWNRNDCCMDRLANVNVEIMDKDGAVLATKLIPPGSNSNVFNLDFDNVSGGRFIRLYKNVHGDLQIAEVEVAGWAASKSPTLKPSSSPTPSPTTSDPTSSNAPSWSPTITLPNVARGKSATQSSTYHHDYGNNVASKAVDGIDGSSTHTECDVRREWWEVDLGDHFIISRLMIVNRLDCCGGRLRDFDISFKGENGEVVDSIHNAVGNGDRKTYSVDHASARYVRIQLRGTQCLQLGEVKVFGLPLSDSPTTGPTTYEPTSSNAPSRDITADPPKNLARGEGALASQSSTCWDGHASRGIDGSTNQYWGGNSITHTCNESQPWWMVDLGPQDYIVRDIIVYNRLDCCSDRFGNSQVQVLDETQNVVATKTIAQGDSSAVFNLNFGNVAGKYVRIIKDGSGALNLAEMEVLGWPRSGTMAINLAREASAVASQSTTCWNGPASRGIDGNTNQYWGGNSITHTCSEAQPWWMVDLGPQDYIVTGIYVYNRIDDCCKNDNGNSQVQVLDEALNVVATETIAQDDTSAVFTFNFDNVVVGRYVRVIRNAGGGGKLTLAEVKVFGWVSESGLFG